MHKYLFDSHCHLNYDGLHENLDKIISNANAAGVQIMQTICTKMDEVKTLQVISQRFKNIFYSVGVHPCNVNLQKIVTPQELIQLATNDQKITGFGETGLDYFRLTGDLEWQRTRFRTHIRAAIACGKPLVIHTRSAAEDTLRIMREENAELVGGVMHCFTENLDVAMQAIALGFYISFSGIVTFKNAQSIKDVARQVPLNRMLVETDSPYLAPIPYRGKTNQPSYVKHVAEEIAQLRSISFEEISAVTTANFFRLFKHARA